MSRLGALVGLLGVVALAGVATYASSRVEVSSERPTRNPAPPGVRVRVEVLNAGGVSGQARAATAQLRELGFDVVNFGNAARFDRDSSAVIDRVGRVELAHAVADALGIARVVTEPDPNLFVDVSVLLGREWRDQVPDDSNVAIPERELWDPRRWFGR